MDFPEPEPYNSGPSQVESVCRAWTSLFINHKPVGLGLDTEGNFLVILEYIKINGRYYEPESLHICVVISDDLSIDSEIQPLYDRELSLSCHIDHSYDDFSMFIDYLRSHNDRKNPLALVLTEKSLRVDFK